MIERYEQSIVVLYTGNVCSTPFVSALGRVPGILAPFHEQLDEQKLASAFPESSPAASFVEVLERLADGRVHEAFDRMGVCSVDDAKHHILAFKWRPFIGSEETERQSQIEVLSRLNCTPIIIVRGSVVDQAIKVVLNEKVYSNRWPQFAAANMSDDDYAEYLEAQRQLSIEFEDEDIGLVLRISDQFFHRTKATLFKGNKLFGVVPDLVRSETFFKPQLDEQMFCNYFSGVLGRDIESLDKDSKVVLSRKAGLETQNVANYQHVASNPRLKEVQEKYSELISSYE